MTALAAAGQTAGLVAETELHGFVAVAIGRTELQHMARTGLDHTSPG